MAAFKVTCMVWIAMSKIKCVQASLVVWDSTLQTFTSSEHQAMAVKYIFAYIFRRGNCLSPSLKGSSWVYVSNHVSSLDSMRGSSHPARKTQASLCLSQQRLSLQNPSIHSWTVLLYAIMPLEPESYINRWQPVISTWIINVKQQKYTQRVSGVAGVWSSWLQVTMCPIADTYELRKHPPHHLQYVWEFNPFIS